MGTAAAGAPPRPDRRRRLRRSGRGRLAHPADELDAVVPPSRGPPRPRTTRDRRCGVVRSARRRRHVHHAAARRGDRDHRAVGGEAVRLLDDDGRRPVPRAAGVRPRRRGGRPPGSGRPAHAGRPGVVAGVAPQARPGALHRVPAVPHARRGMAAHTGGDGRGGRRDLADEPDRAGRLPDRPHGSRARLRARRGRRRQPQPFPRERDARCGHLHARRPRRSPEGPLRRHDHRDDRWRHRVLDPGARGAPRSSERPIWFEMEALCLARSGGGP